jgi:hypothetical protein
LAIARRGIGSGLGERAVRASSRRVSGLPRYP